MPANIFCPSCGTKNDYLNGRKPNFCTSCGHNFQSLAVFSDAPAKPAAQSNAGGLDITIRHGRSNGRGQETYDAPDNEGEQEASISRADVQIEIEGKNKIKVGSLVGTAQPGVTDARHNIKGLKVKTVAKKKVLEQFKQEAGAGGLKKIEIG